MTTSAPAQSRGFAAETRSWLVVFARPCEAVSRSLWLLHDDRLAAVLAHALLGVLVHPMGDARGLATVRAHDHDLAEAERHRLLVDPALLILRRVRLRVALRDVHARHDDRALAGPDLLDTAALASILAGDDDDLVALAQADSDCH